MSGNEHQPGEPDEADDAYALDELLGAYALDALDGDERARVEDYLRINPRAAEEVRQHREVATMLAFTGMDAPEGVWARIERELEGGDDGDERNGAPLPGPELARVLSSSGSGAASASKPVEAGTVVPMSSGRRRWSTALLATAAAVLVVVAAASVVLIVRSDGDGGDPIADAFAEATTDDRSVRAELVADGSDVAAIGVIDPDGHGYVDANRLPMLGADQTYQLWGVMADTGDVVSLGVLGRDPGIEPFTVDSRLSALAVTIEAAPGVISDGNPDGAFVGTF